MIITFRKTAPAHPYFLHILVDIPQNGTDLGVYPKNWTNNCVIAYGILGQVSDVDADKVYDYHTAFDIKPTEVLFNVDINGNQKAMRNIQVERNSANSAATVAMVKELFPFTENNLYRKYFEELYDFSDANNYKLTIGASGVTFTGVNPNKMFSTKDLSNIRDDGLMVNNYNLYFKVSHSPNFTICLVMTFWLNRNTVILAGMKNKRYRTTKLNFDKITKDLVLNGITHITLPNSFNGKKVVLWLTEDNNANVTKASISNYAATLTQNSRPIMSERDEFKLFAEDGVFYRLMYLTNFYDFDSEVFHKVMLQEKLNGSYVV